MADNRDHRTNPFAGLKDVIGDMNVMWDRMYGINPGEKSRERTHVDAWVPATDISAVPDGLMITMELPGVVADDIEIGFEASTLTVSGARRSAHDSNTASDASYFTRERQVGRFRRDIVVPADVRPDDIALDLSRGVLRINVSRSGDAGGHTRLRIRQDEGDRPASN